MLSELRIQGLGVIDDAVLELHPGLNVVTGETGAGKTMVVTGLGLLLGARADAGLVRAGAGTRRGRGRRRRGQRPSRRGAGRRGRGRRHRRPGAGAFGVGRGPLPGPRRRAHRSGRACSARSASTSSPSTARPTSGGCGRATSTARCSTSSGEPRCTRRLQRYTDVYDAHQAAAAELAGLREQARDRAREIEVLQHGLEQLEQVDPQSGEDADLRVEDERLGHAEGLRRAASLAHDHLAGERGVCRGAGAQRVETDRRGAGRPSRARSSTTPPCVSWTVGWPISATSRPTWPRT